MAEQETVLKTNSKPEIVDGVKSDLDNESASPPAAEPATPSAKHPRALQLISEEKKLAGVSGRKTSDEASKSFVQDSSFHSTRQQSVPDNLQLQRKTSQPSSGSSNEESNPTPAVVQESSRLSRSFFRRSSSLYTDPANIQKIKQYLKASIATGERVEIMKYTRAYKEIVKFLCVLGTILSFASRDIEGKVNRMDELLSSDEGKHYLFLDDMLKYELQAGIINAEGVEQVKSHKGKRYGTRIIFRLHQAMAFLVQFFVNVREHPHAKIHTIVSDAYKATISRNHSWLVRKTATVAFYAIPSRNTLIGRMGHDISEPVLMEELREIIAIATDVYCTVAKVLDKYSRIAINEPKVPTVKSKRSSSDGKMPSKSGNI